MPGNEIGKHFQAASEAISNKDPERLRQLLAEVPELLDYRHGDGDPLIDLCMSFANFCGADPGYWTSTPCAEVLLDAGLMFEQSMARHALMTADTGMVRMFLRRGPLQRNLRFLAAAGELAEIEACFDDDGALVSGRPSAALCNAPEEEWGQWPDPADDAQLIADAWCFAIRHDQRDVARFLLQRAVAEPQLSQFVESRGGVEQAVDWALERRGEIEMDALYDVRTAIQFIRLKEALLASDVEAFKAMLAEEPAFLTEAFLPLQVEVLEVCAFGTQPAIAQALLDAGACIADGDPPPSSAMIYAIDYGCREMIELLWPLWPPKDDLPTWAGLGRLDKVRQYFDDDGQLVSHRALVYPRLGESSDANEILLHALGLAAMNEQLVVMEFLLDHGADIDGAWGQHEPASVLHEAAANGRMKSVRLLVERGADVTKRDQRFGGMPHGWAAHSGQEEARAYLEPLAKARLNEPKE